MNFGTLLKNLDPDLRKIVRMIERIRRKLIKRKCSKLYLNKCKEKNVQPKHFRIKHRDKAVKSSLDDLPLSQDILQAEMKHNDTMIENLSKELEHQLNMAKQLIKDEKSNKDFEIVMKELDSIINNSNRVEYTKYSKKRIGADANDKSNETKPNFFINLSNYELTKDEVNFLNLGITFNLNILRYSKKLKLNNYIQT